MCDICVMNSVKNRMLSRRDILRASAAVPVTAAAGLVASAPATLAAGHGRVVDMTHTFSEEFPTWVGEPGLNREQPANFADHGFNVFVYTVDEHSGTHIDAPLHFSADGLSVDEIPVNDLVCPLAVVDIRARAAEDADTQVTPKDLQAWIDANGPIPDGACVAMNSGWSTKTDTPGFRNADADGIQHYPGFHIEATQMLLETGARSIAVDTLSLDLGASQDFATHYAWLPTGRFGIECIANLDEVPASGATLIVGAPKIQGGTGGQARIFALI
ncbi:cyclase family protein [Ruegeria arenilitoris]|uniref:cyclase family protein n=1 Tax=Ruegeria arenilitoris TaxID=1173585 RepID=UPI001479B328|nr:cyclase family protein [Ruegeria arenilitoris]